MSQAGTDEEHDGDGSIGGEGHEGEKNDAEPPMIRGVEHGHACKDMNGNGKRESALFLDFGRILDELYAVDELRG